MSDSPLVRYEVWPQLQQDGWTAVTVIGVHEDGTQQIIGAKDFSPNADLSTIVRWMIRQTRDLTVVRPWG